MFRSFQQTGHSYVELCDIVCRYTLMTTSPECALFRTMLFLVLIFANMVLTTRHGKLLGKYSGPGWNYLDIVFATGKNIKARLCLKKHVDDCHQND